MRLFLTFAVFIASLKYLNDTKFLENAKPEEVKKIAVKPKESYRDKIETFKRIHNISISTTLYQKKMDSFRKNFDVSTLTIPQYRNQVVV